LVYSIKLKLEFSILNSLVELTKNGKIASQSSGRGGVYMDTFDDGMQRRQRTEGEQGAGYTAYIHSPRAHGVVGDDEIRPSDKFVVMTTEVSVHRDELPGSEELENIDGKSGVTAEGRAKNIGDDFISPSSSQVGFAKDGF
jgi:hypothetical protein